MAGGTFTSQNKVRPGAYFNFKSVERPMIEIGDRGIATVPLELNWGATGELIEVFSDELLNGESLAKVGFTAFDSESKLLNLMLQNCYKVLVYRTNTEGVKATRTVGNLTVTAKYAGTLGNNIIVSIVANGELFDVSTFVKGSQQDKQSVSTIAELENNDFVDFSGTGDLEANAGIALTGGTNGTAVAKATYYPLYLSLLETADFQTMAAPDLTDTDTVLKANVVTFVKNQRDSEGHYIQGVIANYPVADYEGIISVKNGFVYDGNVSKEEATAVVAAMTAGANVGKSNTNKVIQGATDLIGKYKNSEIIEALTNGEFLFTSNSRGEIRVEQDINSLHTFLIEKQYEFCKNDVLRVLDQFGTDIKDTWEQSYMGKVNNTPKYRAVFKGDVIAYANEELYERAGALQEKVTADDIEVSQGKQIDAVVCTARLRPAGAMDKLYFTVNVVV